MKETTELRCETTVYRVNGHNDWFEYIVELYEGSQLVDAWDSQFETYNGVPGQRLSLETAREAAAEITHAVEAGEASDWFHIEERILA